MMKAIMNKRFIQIHKEARWSLGLTLLYLAGWIISAYLPGNALGVTRLPLWFEIACIFLPLLFIFLCWLMVRLIFRDMSLEEPDAD